MLPIEPRIALDQLKQAVRAIGQRYPDREERARRLFITEVPASLSWQRDVEFSIKTSISQFMSIPYTAVSFCGSAQLGFSIHKNKLFEPGKSDLDAACINAELFQRAWVDVVRSTRGFTDLTPFGHMSREKIDAFRDQVAKRAMIRVDAMPLSPLSQEWRSFQNRLSRRHHGRFQRISLAIYMNEYAFCWKQDSAISDLLG